VKKGHKKESIAPSASRMEKDTIRKAIKKKVSREEGKDGGGSLLGELVQKKKTLEKGDEMGQRNWQR